LLTEEFYLHRSEKCPQTADKLLSEVPERAEERGPLTPPMTDGPDAHLTEIR
ncbi:hypothetical protein AVEN_268791-1, partial [Araneus ventricosus]